MKVTKHNKGMDFCPASIDTFDSEYETNNFDSENDVMRYFEDQYESEYQDIDRAERASKLITSWLKTMKVSYDFIYNYNPIKKTNTETGVGDHYIDVQSFLGSIQSIVSLVTGKQVDIDRTTRLQGKFLIMLKDGTELSGGWQNGRRNGLGSYSGPEMAKLGILKIVGNYTDGILSGVGKIHMNDESMREGCFFNGKADGTFRGTKRVDLLFLTKLATNVCFRVQGLSG